jgi:hypothetical protein
MGFYRHCLQIQQTLAPPVFVDDIGQRCRPKRPEPAHRIADRQGSIRVNARRQSKCSLRFLL